MFRSLHISNLHFSSYQICRVCLPFHYYANWPRSSFSWYPISLVFHVTFGSQHTILKYRLSALYSHSVKCFYFHTTAFQHRDAQHSTPWCRVSISQGCDIESLPSNSSPSAMAPNTQGRNPILEQIEWGTQGIVLCI